MIVELFVAIFSKIIIYFIFPIAILWLMKELTMGICRSQTSLKGKVVLITGGHQGIGLEVVLALLKRQAKVIIGCQNVTNVKEKILLLVPDADVDVMWLDLSSKDRILHFSKEIKSRYYKIDILINNADFIPKKTGTGENGGRRSGAFAKGGRTKTADGFELAMGENYFGHVLLNHLLLPIMKHPKESLQNINGDSESTFEDLKVKANQSSFCPRIIIMSTPLACTPMANHLFQNNDIQFEDMIKKPLIQYSKSKLAQLMYLKHLSVILREENSNVTIMASYSGLVFDSFKDYVPLRYHKVFNLFLSLFEKNDWQASQTCVHLSTKNFSNNIDQVNGKLFVDCRQNDWLMPSYVKNQNACKKLWDKTEEMLGCKNL